MFSGRAVPFRIRYAQAAPEAGIAGAVRRIIGRDPGQILVSGQNDILVHRAQCCSPLPGEAISGYITKGKGVAVHAAQCSQLADLVRDPERQVSVSWKSTTGTRYDAGFVVRVENRKGMLADITKIIAENDTDIRTFEGAADDTERGNIYVKVAVQNAKEVGAISRLLQNVPGVIEVRRGGPRLEAG